MATKAKEKEVNYTPAQETLLKEGFAAVLTDGKRVNEDAIEKFLEDTAIAFGKTTKSLIAKLSRLGVYVPKTYVNKNGETPVKKDETADAIGLILRLSDGEVDSLTKANKSALVKISTALCNSTPIDPAEEAGKATKLVKAAMIGNALELSEDDARSLARANAVVIDRLIVALELQLTDEESQP